MDLLFLLDWAGANENRLLFWDKRESAYFKYEWAGNGTCHADLWSVLCLSYYLNKLPNALYITDAFGPGDLETGKFNSDAIIGTGISYLLGAEYIIKNKIGIEIDWMKTVINKNDRVNKVF